MSSENTKTLLAVGLCQPPKVAGKEGKGTLKLKAGESGVRRGDTLITPQKILFFFYCKMTCL